jgi:hypothetical protein
MAQSIGHVGNWEYNLKRPNSGDPTGQGTMIDPDKPVAPDEIEKCIGKTS